MKRTYLGAVCESDGSFGIVFRDFPGCVSAGDTLDDVLTNGREALEGHVEALCDGGDFVPAPTSHELSEVITWLEEDVDPSGDTWIGIFPVEIDLVTQPHAVTLAVVADLVHEVSQVLEKDKSELSTRQFIELATRRELERLKKTA